MPTYIVKADIGLRVRSAPLIPAKNEKDNKIDLLAFGQEVSFFSKKGEWFKVKYESVAGKNKTGWVMSQYLELKKKNISTQKPVFKIGIPNLWNDTNTKIVREVIGDEFGGEKHKWDLQCTEYVFYKLKQNGVKIKWPVRSGRDGGKWGEIFKKFNLYKVSDKPTVGGAMCFTDGFKTLAAKKTGHIAYIEKVFADGSIFISEANVPGLGKYNERKLSPALWRDRYKGQFVDFT